MPAYKPDQRQQSSAGELKQLDRRECSPDGIYSGATKRLKMVDGAYSPEIRNASKIGPRALNHGKLPKTPPRP